MGSVCLVSRQQLVTQKRLAALFSWLESGGGETHPCSAPALVPGLNVLWGPLIALSSLCLPIPEVPGLQGTILPALSTALLRHLYFSPGKLKPLA